MDIDGSVLTFLFGMAFVLGVIDGLMDAVNGEADPLDLARPSVEHLEAEALRAAEELRQLDRGEE